MANELPAPLAARRDPGHFDKDFIVRATRDFFVSLLMSSRWNWRGFALTRATCYRASKPGDTLGG